MKDTLVSTAGKNGDDAASGTGKSSGTDIGKASGKNAGGDSLNIYLVGDDIVSVSLKSDLCKELLPKGVYEESDKELHISSTYDEKGYFMFQMTMCTFYPRSFLKRERVRSEASFPEEERARIEQ